MSPPRSRWPPTPKCSPAPRRWAGSSLIEHRASIEGADTPVPDDLLRLSVGIEDAEDLIRDLIQAIEKSRSAV